LVFSNHCDFVVYLGLDVHAETIAAAVAESGGAVCNKVSFRRDLHFVDGFFARHLFVSPAIVVIPQFGDLVCAEVRYLERSVGVRASARVAQPSNENGLKPELQP
jgi:hypothetical protein